MKKVFANKIVSVILAVILIAFLIVLVLKVIPFPLDFGLDEIEPLKNNVVYVEEEGSFPYLYKQDGQGGFSDEEFKIAVFTDLHLTSYLTDLKDNNKTIEMLKKNIEKEQPDLVIFTGDIVTSAFTRLRAKKLAELMEKYKVYWAIVFGNHESENFTGPSREKLASFYESYEYCLFQSGDTDGVGNYIINIKTSQNVVSKSLIFMDSWDYMCKEDIKKFNLDKSKKQYDYIKESQIEWYNSSISALKQKYGDSTESMLFIHIPLPEYKNAYEDGEIIYGKQREKVCSSNHNSGMFTAIKQNNHTKVIFTGHDHINDYCALYEGVYFTYTQPSGYAAYDVKDRKSTKNEDRIQGCSIVTIKSDGQFDIEQKLNSRFS